MPLDQPNRDKCITGLQNDSSLLYVLVAQVMSGNSVLLTFGRSNDQNCIH